MEAKEELVKLEHPSSSAVDELDAPPELGRHIASIIDTSQYSPPSFQHTIDQGAPAKVHQASFDTIGDVPSSNSTDAIATQSPIPPTVIPSSAPTSGLVATVGMEIGVIGISSVSSVRQPAGTNTRHDQPRYGLLTNVPSSGSTVALSTHTTTCLTCGRPVPLSFPSPDSSCTFQRPPILPGTAQAQVSPTGPISSIPVPVSCVWKKKAVLIGLDYTQHGKKDLRLNYASRDARRFAATLTKLGYSDENMKIVTDEEGQPFPSSEYLIRCMDWLVQDVSEGDHLFLTFSGHGEPPKPGKLEPHLVAADLIGIPRSTFQERLVSKIPAGAELTIVLDCCNATGMVELKYCIGRMEYVRKGPQMNKSEPLVKPGNSAIRTPAIHSFPQRGSLYGLPGINHNFSHSLRHVPVHRSHIGGVAAPPLPLAPPRNLVLTPAVPRKNARITRCF